MDWNAAYLDERRLRRIMAMLAALAVLAERAAGSRYPVRCFVLWILRIGESIAEEFVFDATGLPPSSHDIHAAGNTPEDALVLAARLRALAAVLGLLLAVMVRFDRQPSGVGVAFGLAAACSGGHPGGWTPRAYDTS